MISFDNTEIAFRSKTTAQLQKAHILFRFVEKNFLVKLGSTIINFTNNIGLSISWILKPIYDHFVGGETIAACQPVVRQLELHNVKAILDYSVEGGSAREVIHAAMEETLESIKNAGIDPNIPFAVFKPTAFTSASILEKVSAGGELTDEENAEANLFGIRINTLCKTAFEANTPILIDAEDSFYQKMIDDVVEKMMEKFNKEKAIVFNTLQMYRWDRLDFLKELYRKAEVGNYYLGVKFVRGAYMERERLRATNNNYPSPIQPNKESTDNDYNAALQFAVEHINRISLFNGSHNEQSCLWLTELMEKHQIEPSDSRIFTAQLYGMSDHISFNLARLGYNVAKYVPYGPINHVIPYLIRRAEENTSVAGQTGRELMLLKKEMTRRKSLVNK